METLAGSAPLSLFLLTVAGSGERKSTCDKLAMKPILVWEEAEHASYLKAKADYDFASEVFETQRQNRLPQMSLVARYMALDPITRDAFEERTAILEESCGLTRAEAERQAFQKVMRAHHQAAA